MGRGGLSLWYYWGCRFYSVADNIFDILLLVFISLQLNMEMTLEYSNSAVCSSLWRMFEYFATGLNPVGASSGTHCMNEERLFFGIVLYYRPVPTFGSASHCVFPPCGQPQR